MFEVLGWGVWRVQGLGFRVLSGTSVSSLDCRVRA